MSEPTHIVMTGATGFIGAQVAAQFLAEGARVTALLRPQSNSARLQSLPGIETLAYTALLHQKLIAEVTARKPTAFIHCGWRGVAGAERNEAFQITDNIPTTLETVELAAAAGCRQWVGLGSQAEYGNQNRRLNESAPLLPTTLYGKAKLAAGIAALALCEARNLPGAWLRVFSTYGPDDAPQWFIPYVIQEFLAGRPPRLTRCEQLWDYLYVQDAACAVTAVTRSGATGIFNLGSGFSRPLKDCIETIRHELNSPLEPAYGAIPYRPDQVMHLEADTNRLQSSTDWKPAVTLAAGIKATVAFERTRPPLSSSNQS